MTVAARTLSTKGRQTQLAIEEAARTLFAERGFHGTTLADITAAANRSPAVFYRYFTDKEDLLAAMAQSFLRGLHHDAGLPSSPTDNSFFIAAVTVYWNVFSANIGIMVAVDQLAATWPRFAALQNEFRRFGMDIVIGSIRRAREQGYAEDLNDDQTALAITLLFERFTSVCLSPHSTAVCARLTDDDAITTLSTIWKKTLYGF